MAIINIQNFSYSYPGVENPVLRDINLSIDQGSFVVIIGKSGSGKSTLGKALAGFLFQDEVPNYTGSIVVHGSDMTQLPLFKAGERVGYVQQNPEDQFCTLTVEDEITFGMENYCISPDSINDRIDEVLKIVGGQDLKGRTLATLSGGEKQKIAIASLLALQPDVLILDEPTSNLDPIATKQIFRTLFQIQKIHGLTIIIIEHKLRQLHSFNPDIYEIKDGLIVPRSEEHIIETVNPPEDLNTKNNSLTQPTVDSSMVQISALTVALRGKPILNQVDLSLKPTEFVALMGPNGSGKSTLLETIMGFHPIQSGICRLFGHTQTKTSDLVNNIGYIFQNPDHQLFTQSVWDEATFTCFNLGMLDENKQAKAEQMLEKMGLKNRLDDHPQRLSYGEKRRLNLVAAILHNPKLLLIDELLIGQDPKNAHAWMSLLNDYTQEGAAVLLVNHHTELARAYCDRVLFLTEGRIVVDQTPSDAFDAIADLGYEAFLPADRKASAYA